MLSHKMLLALCPLATPVYPHLREGRPAQRLGSHLLNPSSLLALVIVWMQNVERNEENNSILFSLFSGSVQLNQEWEAGMGRVSMLDVSLLINEWSACSFLLPPVCLRGDAGAGLNVHAHFSFGTSVSATLYKTLSIPCLFPGTQHVLFLPFYLVVMLVGN